MGKCRVTACLARSSVGTSKNLTNMEHTAAEAAAIVVSEQVNRTPDSRAVANPDKLTRQRAPADSDKINVAKTPDKKGQEEAK